MENNKKLLKQFFETSKYQDRLDFFDKNLSQHIKKSEEEERKIDRYQSEESLINMIELYQDVYEREDNDEDFIDVAKRTGMNKEGILSTLQDRYKFLLYNFKELGGNISEFPKGLEDLVK